MRNIGLNVVCRHKIEQLSKIPSCIKSFTCRDSNGRFVLDLLERVKIIGRHGLLEEHRLELLDLLGNLYRRWNIKSTVTLDKKIDLFTDRLAYRRHATDRLIKLLIRYVKIILAKWIPLHSGNSALNGYLCLFAEFLGLLCSCKPAVHVNSDLVVYLSAEELINRNAKRFAKYIPKCHFNCRKSRHKHGATSPISVTVNCVPMLFDIKWILSYKIFFYMLDRADKRLFLIFKSRLANSVNAFIGI